MEVFQGPVLGPSRILGLGGAYAGLAEGIDGVVSNVAAPAVRTAYSSHHVEFDVTASAYFPGSFATTDFENRGSVDPNTNVSNFTYGTAGALVQVGPFGAALTADLTSFSLGSGSSTIDFRYVRAHAIVAWAFFQHQLVIGAGVQAVTTNLISGLAPIAPPSGLGPEVGALLKLNDQPWRFGVSARYPVWGGVGGQFTTDGNGNKVITAGTGGAQTYVVPQNVVFPGQIQAGFALQLGPRPLNPKWRDPVDDLAPLRERTETQRKLREQRDAADLASIPDGPPREKRRRQLDVTEKAIRRVEDARIESEEKEIQALNDARYANWPRARLLVVVDALVTAPVDNAVSVSSFLDQRMEKFGRSWTISPRVGLEGEPILDRVLLRFGSYLEPSLFEFGSARQHFTFGGDLKLVQWDVFGLFPKATWQVSFATDLAPRYTNWGISLGLWR